MPYVAAIISAAQPASASSKTLSDAQTPHAEDELYIVTSGRAKFTGGDQTVDVSEGSVFFVAAHEVHRFHDIIEDLTVLVFFGPAEGSRE